MALQADQRAVLQLMLQRGQSYDDIAGLLGVSELDARSRVRGALTELGGADPDREVALTDYLLGQGDPIDRADAIRHLRANERDRDLAGRILTQLRVLAPEADLPRLPGEPRNRRSPISLPRRRGSRAASPGPGPAAGGAGAAAAPSPGAGTSSPSGGPRAGLQRARTSLSGSQVRMLAAIGAGAIILLVVVLLLTGVLGGGGEESLAGESTTTDAASTTTAPGTDPEEAAAAVELQPAGGGDASGVATVGFANGDVPYIDVEIQNLEPPTNQETYFIWFVLEGNRGYPFVPLPIEDGDFTERFQVPSEYLPVLQSASSIDIWLSPNRELGQNIESAVDDRSFVEIPGDQVLSGQVRVSDPAAGSSAGGGGSAGGTSGGASGAAGGDGGGSAGGGAPASGSAGGGGAGGPDSGSAGGGGAGVGSATGGGRGN